MLLLVAAAMAQTPVDHAPLVLERRENPSFPSGTKLTSAACLARIAVGADGRPTSVEVRGCPAPFSEQAADSIRSWRWKPPTSTSGAPLTAMTSIRVKFAKAGATPPAAGECVWKLAVALDGTVRQVAPLPPDPCAAFLPTRVTAVPDEPCTLTLDHVPPRMKCPVGAAAAVTELVAGSAFGPAERNVLEVVPAP